MYLRIYECIYESYFLLYFLAKTQLANKKSWLKSLYLSTKKFSFGGSDFNQRPVGEELVLWHLNSKLPRQSDSHPRPRAAAHPARTTRPMHQPLPPKNKKNLPNLPNQNSSKVNSQRRTPPLPAWRRRPPNIPLVPRGTKRPWKTSNGEDCLPRSGAKPLTLRASKDLTSFEKRLRSFAEDRTKGQLAAL